MRHEQQPTKGEKKMDHEVRREIEARLKDFTMPDFAKEIIYRLDAITYYHIAAMRSDPEYQEELLVALGSLHNEIGGFLDFIKGNK